MNNLNNSKSIFEGLNLVFYTNTTAVSGNNMWLGAANTLSNTIPTNRSKAVDKLIRFSKPFYKLFFKPMPTI